MALDLHHELTPADIPNALAMFSNALGWGVLSDGLSGINAVDWHFHHNSLMGIPSCKVFDAYLFSMDVTQGGVPQGSRQAFESLRAEIRAQLPVDPAGINGSGVDNPFLATFKRARRMALRVGKKILPAAEESIVNSAKPADPKATMEGGIKLDQMKMRLEYDGVNFRLPPQMLEGLGKFVVNGVIPVFIGIKPFDPSGFIAVTAK